MLLTPPTSPILIFHPHPLEKYFKVCKHTLLSFKKYISGTTFQIKILHNVLKFYSEFVCVEIENEYNRSISNT